MVTLTLTLAACTSGDFCSDYKFAPYNYYRIIEGEVAPYQVGFFRMSYGTYNTDPYMTSLCATGNQVRVVFEANSCKLS